MSEDILSVGIDIGTSTTQLVLSKLTIKNMASDFTVPRIVITNKEVVYKSDIIFTPLLQNNIINMSEIEQFVSREYQLAGIDKKEIQTGAVIITGESARRDNANEVLHALSGFAGDFVVATAGPDLESIIAAKGAGIHTYSEDHSTTVVNLDIGGGTTNLAFVRNGEVVDTGCLDIGGRLIKFDPDTKKITYIAPKIIDLIKEEQLHIQVGDIASEEKLTPIVKKMVQLLEESVGLESRSDAYERIVTHRGLEPDLQTECISFTGGVADSIYNVSEYEVFRYGDIGILLGKAVRNSNLFKKFKVVTPIETIRATVVGAGTHTTEISGSTITYTENLFPIKNMPVVKMTSEEEKLDAEKFSKAIETKLDWYNLEGKQENVAIAFKGNENPSFVDVQERATGLLAGMKRLLDLGFPLIVILEEDYAKALGQMLYSQLGLKGNVICIDGIHVQNGDYIDIGSPLAEGKVLPVAIKTLVFH